MALPRSIQAQIEQAEATLAAHNAPVEAQPAAPAPIEVVAAPFADPAPAPAPQPAPTPPVDEAWEHKFRSLQGLFNKEVPSLQGQVKDLNRRLEQALDALESVKAATPAPSEPVKPAVDPRDVENFGADLVDMVERIAESRFGGVSQAVEAKFSAMEAKLADMEKQLTGTSQSVAVSSEQAFFDRLTKTIPEWEAINADPAFLAWLGDADPVYGVPRQRAMDMAREQLDVARVVSVFRAFAPATPAPAARNVVDRQVSPKAGAAPNAQAARATPMLSQKEISDFYNDMARGKWRGREAEAAVFEQSVNEALASGRVR